MWATFYLWLCDIERTSSDGRITLRINDVVKVFPWMSKCRFYNMMAKILLTYGFFERVEKEKWQTTFRSRTKMALPELVRIARATIDRGELNGGLA